jgi:lactate permease
MQASLTDDRALQLALAAIQNSAAGHAAFASMPIILLVLAIAGPGEKTEESDLVRFGLKILLLVVALLVAAGLLLIALG